MMLRLNKRIDLGVHHVIKSAISLPQTFYKHDLKI